MRRRMKKFDHNSHPHIFNEMLNTANTDIPRNKVRIHRVYQTVGHTEGLKSIFEDSYKMIKNAKKMKVKLKDNMRN